MSMGRLVAVLATCLLLAGCSDWPPYAVRMGPHGGVEIVYANCDMETEKIVQVALVVHRTVNGEWDENAPRVWQLDFPTPSALTSVEAGQVPEGAVETIPWREPDPKQQLYVEISYDKRPSAADAWFALEQLGEGRTLYRDEWLSSKEFDERCD